MKAALLGVTSGLLLGTVALVALLGFGWPMDHRVWTTDRDRRPVLLPASFAGWEPLYGQDPLLGLSDDILGGREAQVQSYATGVAPGNSLGTGMLNVVVARGWSTGDSEVVDGPRTSHGAVTCIAPAAVRVPGTNSDGSVPMPLYCERLSDTLSVSALVLPPQDGPGPTADLLAAELDVLFAANS